MKKFVIPLLLLVTSLWTNVTAQTYIPTLNQNYVWEQFRGNNSQTCAYFEGSQVFVAGDTLIGLNTYKKVLAHPIVNLFPGPFCPPYIVDDTITFLSSLLREDTSLQTIFIYDTLNHSEFILYEYDLTDGDTLYNHYGQDLNRITVDSVRNLSWFNLGLRKTVYLHSTGGANQACYIEGIGSIVGLDQVLFIGLSDNAMLTCVFDSNQLPVYGNCSAINVGLENIQHQEINLIYSIGNGHLSCSNCRNLKSQATLNFYDITGRTIHSIHSFDFNAKYQIDLDAPTAIYFSLINESTIAQGRLNYSE